MNGSRNVHIVIIHTVYFPYLLKQNFCQQLFVGVFDRHTHNAKRSHIMVEREASTDCAASIY